MTAAAHHRGQRGARLDPNAIARTRGDARDFAPPAACLGDNRKNGP